MAEREPGYYWMRLTPGYVGEPAQWSRGSNRWLTCGSAERIPPSLVDYVGPRIYPPGEDPVHDELVAALRALVNSTDYGADDDRPLMQQARAALAKADAR